ncbi:putative defects in morphology protein 1 [Rosellinia necatrix]|uniref:Putative defects in morphology protein 1 n=1 Tax=Rosellinia necatrix TaxID=77044 RepID=A0A1W2TE62_ROSNE|nr:putative defects in morphology protein 1 [Rosellinia necatrix]
MAVSISRNVAGLGNVGDIDGDSDYGSDFSVGEEQLVDEILTGLVTGNITKSSARDPIRDLAKDPATRAKTTAATTTATTTTTTTSWNHNGQSHAPLPSPLRGSSQSKGAAVLTRPPPSDSDNGASDIHPSSPSHLEQGATAGDAVRYPDLSQALSDLKPDVEPAQQPPPATATATAAKEPDARTPLQRFRSFPKRPLTVTDLAAGAWCELQHWYTLTRLPGGKKTITTAMRGGSRVHQTLEDEVHTAVRVSIASREEAFALRLWNVIQGLRTLRDTGITRELEVWGTAEGEIFNGVIDQLTHESPNASFEEELNLTSSNTSTQQSSITDYLTSHKTVYLTDVKTRGSDRLPTGTALRPARVQLFLYYRLLSDMAADKVDYSAIFRRYGLNGDARFSDAFMAQIGGLHDEIFYDADSEVEEIPSETYSSDLIGYRSISQIIPLLKAELKETFPLGSGSIGNLLAVQYRHRNDGHIIGNNSFPNDPDALDAYIKENLRWWRGERQPEGVTIEDTYKCNWCEFAETCQWRRDKEAEFLNKKRMGKANGGRLASAS